MHNSNKACNQLVCAKLGVVFSSFHTKQQLIWFTLHQGKFCQGTGEREWTGGWRNVGEGAEKGTKEGMVGKGSSRSRNYQEMDIWKNGHDMVQYLHPVYSSDYKLL